MAAANVAGRQSGQRFFEPGALLLIFGIDHRVELLRLALHGGRILGQPLLDAIDGDG